MFKCVFCKHWKRNGCVVLNGCSRYEPHGLPVRIDFSVEYWSGNTLSDEKKDDPYGNGECVGEGWIRKVCDHPDIADNKEEVTFTTNLLDGGTHDVIIRPKEEFEAARRRLIEEIQRSLGQAFPLEGPGGTCKRKSKPRTKKGSKPKRSRGR